MHSVASPPLNGLSPIQQNYGRPSKVLLELETNPQEGTLDLSKNTKSY